MNLIRNIKNLFLAFTVLLVLLTSQAFADVMAAQKALSGTIPVASTTQAVSAFDPQLVVNNNIASLRNKVSVDSYNYLGSNMPAGVTPVCTDSAGGWVAGIHYADLNATAAFYMNLYVQQIRLGNIAVAQSFYARYSLFMNSNDNAVCNAVLDFIVKKDVGVNQKGYYINNRFLSVLNINDLANQKNFSFGSIWGLSFNSVFFGLPEIDTGFFGANTASNIAAYGRVNSYSYSSYLCYWCFEFKRYPLPTSSQLDANNNTASMKAIENLSSFSDKSVGDIVSGYSAYNFNGTTYPIPTSLEAKKYQSQKVANQKQIELASSYINARNNVVYNDIVTSINLRTVQSNAQWTRLVAYYLAFPPSDPNYTTYQSLAATYQSYIQPLLTYLPVPANYATMTNSNSVSDSHVCSDFTICESSRLPR